MSTTEECDAQNTFKRLKVKMDVLITQIEDNLGTAPVSAPALWKRLKSTGTAWDDFEAQYDKMRNSSGDKRVQDQVRGQGDHTQHADFQCRYYGVLARSEDALINDEQPLQDERHAEEIHLKASNVQQLKAKWKAVHQHIDTSLDEIKTRLEGNAIDSLELLKVKRNQLMAVKEYLKETASLMDSMFNEDHEQTDMMMEAEAIKKTQADTKIRACEEQLAKLQAAINASKAASTGAATPAVTKAPAAPTMRPLIGTRFERRPLPSIKSGELRDYQSSFKADWEETVKGNFEPAEERCAIRECVPKDVKPNIIRLKTMEDIWEFLDDEYGKDSELSSEHLAYLHNIQCSKNATTEAAKFKELHRCWSTVYSDLANVDQLQILNHAPTLKTFIGKLPSKASLDRYIAMEKELKAKKKSDLDVITTFMHDERQTQKKHEEFSRSIKGSSKESDAKVRCHGCNQAGHKSAQCPHKASNSTQKTHATTQNKPKPCPACGDDHSATDSTGKTYFKNHLSVCDAFRDKSPAERAAIIEQTKGCALCLDWSVDHQAKACQAKGKFGKFKVCKLQVSGSLCGKRHNHLLHGSSNSYCNSVKRVMSSNNGMSNVLGKDVPGAPFIKDIEAADSIHALLQLQLIPVKNKAVKQASTFYDPGSNVNLVRKKFVKEAGWKGRAVLQSLVTTGSQVKAWQTEAYHVPLVDRKGTVHKVLAYSIDTITAPTGYVNIRPALKVFPEVNFHDILRPEGDVDLLLSIQDADLHPILAKPNKQ